MITVTDIIDLLIDRSAIQTFPTFRCPGACQGTLSMAVTAFNRVCGPHLWELSQWPIAEAKVATTQDWLYTCLDGYGIHANAAVRDACCRAELEHALTCAERLTWTIVFRCNPTFIVLQLFQEYASSTRINLEVSVPVGGELVLYRLGCIIYYTRNHFVSRILPLGRQIYEYDSQIFEGMLQPCRLEKIDLSTMYIGHAHLALYFHGNY